MLRQYYRVQASWDAETRNHLYRLAKLHKAKTVLDAGTGTGVVARELAQRYDIKVTALDRNRDIMEGAGKTDKKRRGSIDFQVGDLIDHHGSYDAVLCRFFLMWQEDMEEAVKKMKDLVEEGGVVVALAEPDYGGRLELPEDLGTAELWIRTIESEGGDPYAGRKLLRSFQRAGLKAVHNGLSSGMLGPSDLRADIDKIWDMLIEEIKSPRYAEKELRAMRKKEYAALKNGKRYVFTPVFWALGWNR